MLAATVATVARITGGFFFFCLFFLSHHGFMQHPKVYVVRVRLDAY